MSKKKSKLYYKYPADIFTNYKKDKKKYRIFGEEQQLYILVKKIEFFPDKFIVNNNTKKLGKYILHTTQGNFDAYSDLNKPEYAYTNNIPIYQVKANSKVAYVDKLGKWTTLWSNTRITKPDVFVKVCSFMHVM